MNKKKPFVAKNLYKKQTWLRLLTIYDKRIFIVIYYTLAKWDNPPQHIPEDHTQFVNTNLNIIMEMNTNLIKYDTQKQCIRYKHHNNTIAHRKNVKL